MLKVLTYFLKNVNVSVIYIYFYTNFIPISYLMHLQNDQQVSSSKESPTGQNI